MNGINGIPNHGPRIDANQPRTVNGTTPALPREATSAAGLGHGARSGQSDGADARATLLRELPALRTTDRGKALRDSVRGELDRAFGAGSTPGLTDAVLEAFETSESLQTLFHRVWSQAQD